MVDTLAKTKAKTKATTKVNAGGKSEKQALLTSYVEDSRPLCEGTPFVLTDAAHPRLTLKQGSHFLVLDEVGFIPACNTLGYGYYRHDTRHLSQWEVTLNGIALSVLSNEVHQGYGGTLLYTNPLINDIPQQKLSIKRKLVLDDLLWEKITIENFGTESYDIDLQIKFQSDFADMFEVRGLNRSQRGQRMLPTNSSDGKKVFLAYRGLEGLLAETEIEFCTTKPETIADGLVTFKLRVPVKDIIELETRIITKWDGEAAENCDIQIADKSSFHSYQSTADDKYKQWRGQVASISTGHELVNFSIERCFNDIYILRQPTPKGNGLAAGIPWYCTIFGRDSAITGLQILPFMPEIARDCITVLAAYQGKRYDEFTSEQPGRIMHEIRIGELARTKQIPHIPYYGTIDATQLWLMLFCEYIKWTGDLEFAKSLWPAVKLALSWLDKTVEEGNGYLRYKQKNPHELENQGWKDSRDSIMYRDGTLAQPPIAVCEAQGYLYAAQRDLSQIASMLGHKQMAKDLINSATVFKDRFNRDFWMEADRFICLALDGNNRKADVISSNPGHCLWSGILNDDKAQMVADRLMQSDVNSGWGIRTLSAQAVDYSPIAYHNGTVWPHDNAIIGEGMRHVGRTEEMQKIMQEIVEVSLYYTEHRLPELICGFDRVGTYSPVGYPVSCSPQAWAAGSLLQMIKACINFLPDAANNTLRIVEPSLPEWLGRVTVKGLKVGKAELDLAFDTREGYTICQILRKTGKVKVIVET